MSRTRWSVYAAAGALVAGASNAQMKVIIVRRCVRGLVQHFVREPQEVRVGLRLPRVREQRCLQLCAHEDPLHVDVLIGQQRGDERPVPYDVEPQGLVGRLKGRVLQWASCTQAAHGGR